MYCPHHVTRLRHYHIVKGRVDGVVNSWSNQAFNETLTTSFVCWIIGPKPWTLKLLSCQSVPMKAHVDSVLHIGGDLSSLYDRRNLWRQGFYTWSESFRMPYAFLLGCDSLNPISSSWGAFGAIQLSSPSSVVLQKKQYLV